MSIERGIILPDSHTQREIQKHSETADWDYKKPSVFLYQVGSEMMSRFFNGLVYPDGKKVPNPLFAFDNARNNNVLGFYDLFPDEFGLMYKITINTAHFEDKNGEKVYKFGDWALCEVALHEMLHAWQQHGRGKDPYKKGRNTHNAEFVKKAKELGLNVTPVVGSHYQVADADSPFGILMKQFGIARPEDVPRAEGVKTKDDWFEIGKKRKGKSSLTKYSCGCQNAWIGASEFLAVCKVCGNEFVQATALREVMNAMAEEPEPPVQPQPQAMEPGVVYPVSIDIDAEIDRLAEADQERIDREMDAWEDLGSYLDQYQND